MTQFRTFTDAERAALKLHGLDTHRPSQLSDAFVLGMRFTSNRLREAVTGLEPDTRDMAYSGRGIDYVNGYERGYETVKDDILSKISP